MVERERQHSFSRFLDKAEKNKLFVRFVFSLDYASVEEFAVVYLIEIEGEIILGFNKAEIDRAIEKMKHH